jgi:hypothetical protein
MSDIFISHAVADGILADKFVAFLKEGIGVPAKSIFCSSIPGQGVPLANDFNEYMKKTIQSPQLVILLMTPRYMESYFCLMELGATWAKSLKALPIVVPPIKFDVISRTLGLTQGWSIDNGDKLVDLREMIKSLNIPLEHRTEHDWDKKRAAWKAELKKLLTNLAPPTNVLASEHKIVQNELETLKKEFLDLQEVYGEATNTIDELKAAKDPVAVKTIMAKRRKFDAETRFNELLSDILELKPKKVSTPFYRNMIMDRYDKAVRINWYDHDQKTDAENAIQYKLMEKDEPFGYLWNSPKLRDILNALTALEYFLQSEEAREFVQEFERKGRIMEFDDLEFWEQNLK